MNRHLRLPLVTALLLGALYFALRLTDEVPSAVSDPSAQPTAPSRRVDGVAAGPARPAHKRLRQVYELVTEQRGLLGGEELGSGWVTGTWTTTARSDGRMEVQLLASRIALKGTATPSADQVPRPVQLVTREDGVLSGVAFPEGMPDDARSLLTNVATTFQHTLREEAAWTVVEEDQQGTYRAQYRRADDAVYRSRDGYLSLRSAQNATADDLTVEEKSEFRYDGLGLVSATVDVAIRSELGPGLSLEIFVKGSLRRTSVAEIDEPEGPALLSAGIRTYVDARQQAESADRRRVGKDDSRTLLSRLLEASRLPRGEGGGQKVRSDALERMAAGLRLDPAAAVQVAAVLRRESDANRTSLLAGALASAQTPEATHQLTELLSESLSDAARGHVVGALGFAKNPTTESVAALARERGARASEAILALGTQAHTAGPSSGVAEAALDVLLERYANAQSLDERHLLMQALGNSGHPRALPVMVANLQGSDMLLASIATYGLRFIPGAEVDSILTGILSSGSPLVMPALRAVAYRDPSVWRPILAEAKVRYAGIQQVQDAITAVLSHWPQYVATASGTSAGTVGHP